MPSKVYCETYKGIVIYVKIYDVYSIFLNRRTYECFVMFYWFKNIDNHCFSIELILIIVYANACVSLTHLMHLLYPIYSFIIN